MKNFTLVSTLGTGTFGRVFLAKKTQDQSYFALKIQSKSKILKLKQTEHVNFERRLLESISHPFIVSLESTFQSPSYLYMCLEFVVGGELFSHLRRAGRFKQQTAVFYAASIVCAIDYLHSQDVIYRDLKPENLLLDEKGYLKLVDFGLSKQLDSSGYAWTLCGTPEYIAPEIILSQGHGTPVDWWALGILVYEMLVGHPPFVSNNPFEIYQKVLLGELYFPIELEKDAEEFIRSLLNLNPAMRLGSSQSGVEDIKNSKFFEGMEWETLVEGGVPAPIIPYLQSQGDTGNFERYPEPEEGEARHLMEDAYIKPHEWSTYNHNFFEGF